MALKESKKYSTKTFMIFGAVFAFFIFLFLYDPEPKPEPIVNSVKKPVVDANLNKEAVQSVVNIYDNLDRSKLNNTVEVEKHIARVDAIDISECPEDFRLAYKKVVHAMENMLDLENQSIRISKKGDNVSQALGGGDLGNIASDITNLSNLSDSKRIKAQIQESIRFWKKEKQNLEMVALKYGVQMR